MNPGYRIRNWTKFQHYKDRNPPWIKLHVEMLQSEDWVMLDDASKLLAVVCMIIAAKHDGAVPDNPDYIKRVAYLNHRPNLNPLVKCGFLEILQADASGSKQKIPHARPEKESESYSTEGESKGSKVYVNAARPPVPVEPPIDCSIEQSSAIVKKLAVEAWNDLAGRIGLPAVQRLTTARAAALRARLIEVGGIDGWLAALAKIEASPFLRGEGGRAQGHDGWRCNFDWLISQRGFTRLLEGAFDSTPGTGGKGALARAMRDLVEQTEEPVQ